MHVSSYFKTRLSTSNGFFIELNCTQTYLKIQYNEYIKIAIQKSGRLNEDSIQI
jgi:hypothetical protein